MATKFSQVEAGYLGIFPIGFPFSHMLLYSLFLWLACLAMSNSNSKYLFRISHDIKGLVLSRVSSLPTKISYIVCKNSFFKHI